MYTEPGTGFTSVQRPSPPPGGGGWEGAGGQTRLKAEMEKILAFLAEPGPKESKPEDWEVGISNASKMGLFIGESAYTAGVFGSCGPRATGSSGSGCIDITHANGYPGAMIPGLATSGRAGHMSQWYEIHANNLSSSFTRDKFYNTKTYLTTS